MNYKTTNEQQIKCPTCECEFFYEMPYDDVYRLMCDNCGNEIIINFGEIKFRVYMINKVPTDE